MIWLVAEGSTDQEEESCSSGRQHQMNAKSYHLHQGDKKLVSRGQCVLCFHHLQKYIESLKVSESTHL